MNADNPLLERYRRRLKEIPAPGGGQCHVALLGVANVGIMAGVEPQQVFDEIRQSIPTGWRKITDKEIQDAINRALQDAGKQSGTYQRKPQPVVKDGKAALQKILERATSGDEADLRESSPIRIDWKPSARDTVTFLKAVFNPNDLVFIGYRTDAGIMNENIRTVAAWVAFFQTGGTAGPFLIINPLSGTPVPKKSGEGVTYRSDANVETFKHALVEFDDLGRGDQIRFWMAINMPIKALVDTGGKSIHGLIDISSLEIETAEDWDHHIKRRLYEQHLVPLGVDRACKNPARLSRLPGVVRPETGKMQRVLWLSPIGRRCANG